MKTNANIPDIFQAAGDLVQLPAAGRRRALDGFWCHGVERKRALLIVMHGMHSNFYRSALKKEMMRRCGAEAFDLLLFNNQGAELGTEDERFADGLHDLDAALAFGAREGYRQFLLAGHSTGCQKVTIYQARRARPEVKALLLLAPCDDYAISRRDLGARYRYWVRRAQTLVNAGRGEERMPACCMHFAARRFLSVADPASPEAQLFDYGGPMKQYRRIETPLFVLFGTREEYACRPVREMLDLLAERDGDWTLTPVL
jgi:pimeloyl-ACP methyl ester carboxylesterase